MEGRIGEVRRFGLKDDGSKEIVYMRMAEDLSAVLYLKKKGDTTIRSTNWKWLKIFSGKD